MVSQVVHDCRNDSAALFFQCEVQVNSVFDTQVSTTLHCTPLTSYKDLLLV